MWCSPISNGIQEPIDIGRKSTWHIQEYPAAAGHREPHVVWVSIPTTATVWNQCHVLCVFLSFISLGVNLEGWFTAWTGFSAKVGVYKHLYCIIGYDVWNLVRQCSCGTEVSASNMCYCNGCPGYKFAVVDLANCQWLGSIGPTQWFGCLPELFKLSCDCTADWMGVGGRGREKMCSYSQLHCIGTCSIAHTHIY